MKRFTLFMAAIICLATSAMAQISEDQTLSPALWKQGIATCAHYTAHGRGFAKRIEEIKAKYPNGYSLDDLNEVYSNQGRRWEKIYNEFKKEENKSGSINDLKELVTPQIWKLVEPEFTGFITEHPNLVNEAPAPQPGDQPEAAEGEQQQEGQTDGAVTTTGKTAGSGISCNANLPLWLGIIGTLLGLCALLTALSNRGKVKELRRSFAREIERTNANLQEFSTDAAEQMKAISIRLTGKAIKGEKLYNEPEPAVEPEPIQDEADAIDPMPVVDESAAAEEEHEEVMNLFMSRPDENDDFTRVSDTFEPGNSIYVLTTFDGQRGTFEVIDKPEVHTFALMMPAENLIRACSGNAIQIPNGNRIVTDRAGEAEFIDGRWHVVVKAIIHYEG